MKSRWRFRHKLTAGLLLVVGMTGLLSAGSVYGLYSYRRSNKIFKYHQGQIERLGNLEKAFGLLHFPPRDARDTLASPKEAKDEKYRRLERIDAMIDKYRAGLANAVDSSFTSDGADKQFAALDTMQNLVKGLRALYTGAQPEAVTNSPSRLRPWWYIGNEEEDLIARLDMTLDKLRGVIHAEVVGHMEADRNNYRASLAVVYSTTVLVVVMLFVLVWLGYRAIFTPIQHLHQGVLTLAQGDFASRVHLNSGDEVQELGEAFNTMADRLEGIYHDLNRQVEERSRQLIRSERLASVGFLAAGVAHEINNPLASIAFCSEALASRLRETLANTTANTEVFHNYLQMIQEEAFRCKAITEKLLDFSRTGEPERLDTDLTALIKSVLEMVRHLGRTKGKTVLFDPTELLMVRGNPQELKQVLLNLVVNGLEAVNEEGIVEIHAECRNGWAELRIRDNGCGMGPEVLENLFEPFFTRKTSGKGTGLGLSISHLIVSQHGGTLDAQSAGPETGSTFVVRLPLAQSAPSATSADGEKGHDKAALAKPATVPLPVAA